MLTSDKHTRNVVLTGTLVAVALTAIIAMTAARLAGFTIVGRTVPFAYPWRLVEPSTAARVTSWGGYALHNLFVWGVILMARRESPTFQHRFRWYNWAMLAGNVTFVGLHMLQTHSYYDGLAQDVPEITALGSVALMLMVVLILEAPRRGLMFGRCLRFDRRFIQLVREYHGYLFSWAIVYTYWYHPTEATVGHLAGFFYMFMLFGQSVLIFNRAHVNRWWTLTLEILVLPHGVLVAMTQPGNGWRMFGFGFGAMFIITQMHGLGLGTRARVLLAGGYALALLASYGSLESIGSIHEIIRIPMLDFAVVVILYLLWLSVAKIVSLLRPSSNVAVNETHPRYRVSELSRNSD